jgi:hypothetical protein
MASRSRGLTVRASPRTSLRMVLGLAPVARAMRAEPWPMTWSARSRSRVPFALSRCRGSDRPVTLRTAAAVAGCARLRPEARPRTVAGESAAAAAIER